MRSYGCGRGPPRRPPRPRAAPAPLRPPCVHHCDVCVYLHIHMTAWCLFMLFYLNTTSLQAPSCA